MHVDNFVNEKISQLIFFLTALLRNAVHPTEVELFIWDTLEEWAQLNVTDEMPSSARERVFWHLIHELKLASLNNIDNDANLVNEIENCLLFLIGKGHHPIHCVGWRPLA
ncbi:hypothetical protein [Thalassotalea aquiviva]|uniref:hypothetical protein n=1 Tax=Thalassotalea aquiviva TaxID=3242415 RepID=UPI00352A5C06